MVPLRIQELRPSPDPLALARTFARLPMSLWLDSAQNPHPERGRYSFLCADPVETLRLHCTSPDPSPFARLDAWLARMPMERVPDLPPFQGGIAGLFGYGLAHAIERLPRSPFDEFAFPDLCVGLYDLVVGWDHRQDRCWLMQTPLTPDADRRWDRSLSRIRSGEATGVPRGTALPRSRSAPSFAVPGRPGVFSNFSPEGFQAAVARAIDYIHAGDIFQVNLAQRLMAAQTGEAFELYSRLRQGSSAPFSAWMNLGDVQVASASPERFLRVEDGLIETRPIKGTRKRGATPEEDAALVEDLRTSPKDRAENVMIVDLLRNDIGKVARFGSVAVTKALEIETFPYVHHMVSEVQGRLREGSTIVELLRGAFPGGSITGAPKVRAMEIVAELEPTVRGPYCGSVGYLGFDGAMDTNILIRTFAVAGGRVQFPVGGGIVADSRPLDEYQETLHKAAGMFRALE